MFNPSSITNFKKGRLNKNINRLAETYNNYCFDRCDMSGYKEEKPNTSWSNIEYWKTRVPV